jgi:uncharacterized protein (DUF2252 family)
MRSIEPFFCEKGHDLLINILVVQRTQKVIKITNRSLDHLAITTDITTSRRRVAVLTPIT